MTIRDDIRYVGVNDHDIDLFEGQYVVPRGMAYNSYAIIDGKIAFEGSLIFTIGYIRSIGNPIIRFPTSFMISSGLL